MAAALRTLGERFMSSFTAPVSDDEVEMAIYEKEDVELECLNLGGRTATSGPDSSDMIDHDGAGEIQDVIHDNVDRPSPPGALPLFALALHSAESTCFRHASAWKVSQSSWWTLGRACWPAGAGGWQLEDVRVNGAQAARLPCNSHDDSARADPDKWTLVSRLSSSLAQSAQPHTKASSSGCTTPSNLERAVLLLEAEGERESQGNSGIAPASKPGAQGARRGLSRSGSGERGGSMADAQDPAQEHADVRGDRGSPLCAGASNRGVGANESDDEGPRTPPTNSGDLRSSQEPSSPDSAAGAHLSPSLAPGEFPAARLRRAHAHATEVPCRCSHCDMSFSRRRVCCQSSRYCHHRPLNKTPVLGPCALQMMALSGCRRCQRRSPGGRRCSTTPPASTRGWGGTPSSCTSCRCSPAARSSSAPAGTASSCGAGSPPACRRGLSVMACCQRLAWQFFSSSGCSTRSLPQDS